MMRLDEGEKDCGDSAAEKGEITQRAAIEAHGWPVDGIKRGFSNARAH